MSSYSVLLAASGFWYDGPPASLTFRPKFALEDFRAFFSAGTGWGMLSQRMRGMRQLVEIGVEGESVDVRCLHLHHIGEGKPGVTVEFHGIQVDTDANWNGDELTLRFGRRLTLNPGDLILTGTPDGVADSRVGDEIVTEIEGLGRLVNTIVGDAPAAS